MKKKWSELLTKNLGVIELFVGDGSGTTLIPNLIATIDEKYDAILPMGEDDEPSERLTKALGELGKYLSATNSAWKDMPIYMSSYKWEDERIFTSLYSKLIEYLGFYNRILTDSGVAKKIVTHRTYSASASSSGESKDYDSETPQANLDNFDDAIKYASRLGKSEDSASKENEGESDFTLTQTNYDESLKNLKIIFYNDLVGYILRIPEIIYDYYSLDTMPVNELVKEYNAYIREMYAH